MHAWTDVPDLLCVSLTIPREALAPWRGHLTKNGTPIMQLKIRTKGGENYFMNLQVGFGHITTSGRHYTNSFKIRVEDDGSGWNGTQPAVASVIVPTSLLVHSAKLSDVDIEIALTQTPANMSLFVQKLGISLGIHKTTLHGDGVYISKDCPNLDANSSMIARGSAKTFDSGPVTPFAQLKMNSMCEKISNVVLRFDVTSEAWRETLHRKEPVNVDHPSIYSSRLVLGPTQAYTVELPLSLNKIGKIRIARQSSWVEYSAPVVGPDALTRQPESMYPVSFAKG